MSAIFDSQKSGSNTIFDVQVFTGPTLTGSNCTQTNTSSAGAVTLTVDEAFQYCTYQDLIDRYGATELVQLTDRPDRTDPENAGSFNPVVLAQAIRDSEAEINSYLTAYPLPLAVVPANLLRIACDITRYYLYDDQMIEPVQKRYKDAIDWLKLVAAGKIALPPDALGNVPVTASDDVDFQTQDTVFTPNTLSGF